MNRRYADRVFRILACGVLLSLYAAFFAGPSSAYWVWTPETKKFINPKYAVKDTPKEQFDWAMSFYDAKDYKRAAEEFEKLTKHYEFSEYASKAQYYAGLSFENMGKHYVAFQAYQKAVDNFPHIENMDEIIAREFNIANIYAKKASPKVLGTDIMTSNDRAIEIYKKVVDNAPFGKLADQAQFRMGDVLKRAGSYEEATVAFQKVVDDYPNSEYASKAQYEVAYCAYRASLQPAYDAGPTDRAIQIFQDLSASNKDAKMAEEAAKTMQRLKDKAAEKSMLTAKFYEDRGHPKSAIIYYEDVLDRYSDSVHAAAARSRIVFLESRKAKAGGTGNVFGAFGKKGEKAPRAAKAPAPKASVPKKKGRGLFGWFGKKEARQTPVPPEKSEAFEKTADQVAHQVAQQSVAAGAPAAAGAAAAQAAAQGAIPTITAPQGVMPSAMPPAGAAGAAPVNPVVQEPLPVAYEEKGLAQPAPRTDDPNVEVQDDDRM